MPPGNKLTTLPSDAGSRWLLSNTVPAGAHFKFLARIPFLMPPFDFDVCICIVFLCFCIKIQASSLHFPWSFAFCIYVLSLEFCVPSSCTKHREFPQPNPNPEQRIKSHAYAQLSRSGCFSSYEMLHRVILLLQSNCWTDAGWNSSWTTEFRMGIRSELFFLLSIHVIWGHFVVLFMIKCDFICWN